mmetsp:Transcript_146283/g.467378  ORF Transcript_146283/g.467378 Transcript_146283/m.467378 type:complete len:166 (-) Transcript_146283:73-570(-)
MPSGTMKRWNAAGFGFIAPDDGGDDLFCHVSCLLDGEGSVQEGDTCKFKITYNDKKGKDQATDVTSSGGGGGGRSGGGGGRDRSRSRGRGGGGGGGGGRGGDDKEMCGDFKRGNCDRGDRCRYSHGDGESRGGGGRDDRDDRRGGRDDRDDRRGGRDDRDYDRRR